VRCWERTENLKFFGEHVTAEQRDWIHSLVLPSIVYDADIELFLGDRKILVRVLPGHTGGDSVVVVPDADVVFTGDLFRNHCLPNLIDAATRAQIASNRIFVVDYARGVFVPAQHNIEQTADELAHAKRVPAP